MFISLENITFVIGNFNQVVDFLLEKINKKSSSRIILPCSLHDLALKSEEINEPFYQMVDYCTSDSMFLTRFFRWKYKHKVDRVYGPDLMLAILDKGKQLRSKHFFLAPNQNNMKKIKTIIAKKYPKMKCTFGFLPDNISEKEEASFLQQIVMAKPDFVWLGIGSPKQVKLASWLKNNLSFADIFCVGAAFDFLSGNKKQAPTFLQKNGLEWFFRLVTEPRRLWRRYLITIPRYLISFLFK